MAQKLASRQSQAISLKGSTKIVAEFFDFSVVRRPSPSRPAPALLPVLIAACLLLIDVGGQNNILYQRGIYPTEDFKMVKKCVCCSPAVSRAFVACSLAAHPRPDACLSHPCSSGEHLLSRRKLWCNDRYGLPMLTSTDESVKTYLKSITDQVQGSSLPSAPSSPTRPSRRKSSLPNPIPPFGRKRGSWRVRSRDWSSRSSARIRERRSRGGSLT